MSEVELIVECQNGNRESFGKLYDIYVRDIYDFIYYKTHHKQTAEDLTSEVFVRVLTKIGQFDKNKVFKAWLYTIARNAVIDHYRKDRPTSDIEDTWDIKDEDVDIVADLDTKEKVAKLKEELKKLPSLQRDIVMLRVWQGKSYREIAEIVGKTEGNCKVIYSRALQDLRGTVSAVGMALLIINL